MYSSKPNPTQISMKFTTVFYGAICSLAFLGNINAIKLQIFKDYNYKGLTYVFDDNAIPIKPPCQTLDPVAHIIAGSVKLDTCLIGFENTNCKGNSFKVQPGHPDLAKFMRKITSYRRCTAENGGSKLKVDLLDKDNNTLVRYKEICGCQDIPTQVSVRAEKLNNYMNCVKIYASKDCSGKGQALEGGQNVETGNLRLFGSYVRSISECEENPTCVKVQSKIYKFVLSFEGDKLPSPKDVDLAAKTTFYNNGSATVSQTYHASKTITQVFETTRSSKMGGITDSKVDEDVKSEVKDSKGFNAGLVKVQRTVTETVKTTNSFERSEESSVTAKFTTEEANTFSITQSIEIPPCSQYDVSSKVTIVENVPIEYEIYTRVTGETNGVPVPIDEMRKYVSDMTHVEDQDEYTGIYMTKSVVFANFGVDTYITGEGSQIPNCDR